MTHDNLRLQPLGDGAGAVRARLAELAGVDLVDDAASADLIVLTPADLDDLIEDAAATAAYERTKDQETVPLAVVDRLLAGENPVRVWREHRGHTLSALARAAGIGKGYLSQIEAGERVGTVETLQKLATALDLDLADVAPPRPLAEC